MATSRLTSLNCSICDELLVDQKILNCAHTFCVNCLKGVLDVNQIKCPLCRDVTLVPDGEISNLRTNVALSSVVDYVNNKVICNAQEDPTHQEIADFFCHVCDTRFCAICFGIHNQIKPNRRHKAVTIEEHKQQKLTYPTVTNNEHIEKDQLASLVCVDCNKFVSNSLKGRLHVLRKHTFVTESEYTVNTRVRAEQLQAEVTETLAKIRTINTSYASLEEEVRSFSYNVIHEINEEYEDNVRQLRDRKLTLTKHCQTLQENASKRCDEIERKTRSDIRRLVDGSDLVGSSLEDSHNITAFAELCDNLSRLLTVINGRARDVSLEEEMRVASSMSFHGNRADYGELKITKWQKSTKFIQVGKNMSAVDTSEEGCIAIGYFEGGVEFHEAGQESRVVLEDTGVLGIAFLRDSCVVVRDVDNKVQLFSTDMELKNNTYRTLTHEDGGDGCLAVDGDDNIYISYRSIMKIHIFARKGGKVIREIDCLTYTPQQIAVLSKQHMLVMDGSVITTLTNEGPSSTQIMYPGCHGYPCVSSDGSLLVAWVDRIHSILRIDQYTKGLKIVRCVYSSNTIDLSGRSWYFLRELSCGQLVFCTNKKLTILKQDSVCFEKTC